MSTDVQIRIPKVMVVTTLGAIGPNDACPELNAALSSVLNAIQDAVEALLDEVGPVVSADGGLVIVKTVTGKKIKMMIHPDEIPEDLARYVKVKARDRQANQRLLLHLKGMFTRGSGTAFAARNQVCILSGRPVHFLYKAQPLTLLRTVPADSYPSITVYIGVKGVNTPLEDIPVNVKGNARVIDLAKSIQDTTGVLVRKQLLLCGFVRLLGDSRDGYHVNLRLNRLGIRHGAVVYLSEMERLPPAPRISVPREEPEPVERIPDSAKEPEPVERMDMT